MRFSAITATVAALGFVSLSALADTSLPTTGHFYAVGTVSSTTCQNEIGRGPVGTIFQGILETHAVNNAPLLKLRTVAQSASDAGIFELILTKTGGTKLAPTGTFVLSYNTSPAVTGTYSAANTSLDPNSYVQVLTVNYDATGFSSPCTEVTNISYIRASGQ